MKAHIHIPAQYDAIIRKMAEEGGLSVADLCEVAIYNIIAVYMQDNSVAEEFEDGLVLKRPEGSVDMHWGVGTVDAPAKDS